MQRGPQQCAVAFAHSLKTTLETLLESRKKVPVLRPCARVVLLEPELRERRYERARQDVGGEHCKHHGFRQWDEQELGDSRQQKHGNEYDANRQSRDQCRQRNLMCAVEDRGLHILTVLKVVIDVFDGHRGVIDQDTHGQCQSAQRHDVDGLA
jgi:hypothetical protein